MKTKFGKFLGVTQEKLEEAKNKFQKHHKKTLIFSKLFHGFGLAGLITAGILRINYWKYLITCVSVTMIQAMILLIIGILFGSAYQTFGRYISYFAETTIAIGICVIIYLIARNRIKSKKHENLNS